MSDIIEEAKKLRKDLGKNIHEEVVESIFKKASSITARAEKKRDKKFSFDNSLDNILTSKVFGFPIMLLLLTGVFYLTIKGANIPSEIIAGVLFGFENKLVALFQYFHVPAWIEGLAVHGCYRALAWVVSVMLPPMAIFFPIFTFLEDLGYLPRVVFNLDYFFRKVGASGKQALTMSMGFGCNAAGIISTRIIHSPKERLIAIITNNFVPCNGRWPTLIVIATIFVGGLFPEALSSIAAASAVIFVTMFGVFVTFLVSAYLSRTWLKSEESSFQLELPPFRRPNILQIIYTSLIDRTIYVLGRAVAMAIPAGAVIWLLANIHIGQESLFQVFANILQPVGHAIGLDGVILLAFIVAIPANEIVVPTMIMGYLATGQMTELTSIMQLKELLMANGWNLLTAVCLMLFSLLHYPCSTTTWTIWKETKSVKWTVFSNVLPTAVAFIVCFAVAQIARLIWF